jgi:hypothetical protein
LRGFFHRGLVRQRRLRRCLIRFFHRGFDGTIGRFLDRRSGGMLIFSHKLTPVLLPAGLPALIKS